MREALRSFRDIIEAFKSSFSCSCRANYDFRTQQLPVHQLRHSFEQLSIDRLLYDCLRFKF